MRVTQGRSFCEPRPFLSLPNDNVLNVPSRNVLLTRGRWGVGKRTTSHDTERARPIGSAEEGQERPDHATASRRRDRGERTSGAPDVSRSENARRQSGHPCGPRTGVEPSDRSVHPPKGHSRPQPADLPRFWTDVCRRASEPRAWNQGGPRDVAGLDARGQAVASQPEEGGEGAPMAGAQRPPRRNGAVGYQRARLAGRQGRETVSDLDDRRCQQRVNSSFRCARFDRREPALVVELSGAERASGVLLHRQGEPVSNGSQSVSRRERNSCRRTGAVTANADRPGVERVGNCVEGSTLAAGQRADRAQLSDGAGPAGERLAFGWCDQLGASQCLSGSQVSAVVESKAALRAGQCGRCAPAARPGARPGFLAQPCRSAASGQRLHRALRRKVVPDRPDGGEGGSARWSRTCGTASGWDDSSSISSTLDGGELVHAQTQAICTGGGCQTAAKAQPSWSQRSHAAQHEQLSWWTQRSHKECRAKAARQSIALTRPRPPLASFTNECRQRKTPLAEIGSEGDCRFFGASSVASASGIRSGATPCGRTQPTMTSSFLNFKADISIWPELGHFYLALTTLQSFLTFQCPLRQ